MGRNSLSITEQNNRLKQVRPDFDKVFQMFNQALLFFATRLIKDGQAAQDIVADVFVKYWQKRSEFETVYNAKAFLYISTRNACLNHNHRENYQAAIREKIRVISTENSSASLNESVYIDILARVYSLINKLPVRCRNVMLKTFMYGFGTKEIARQMNISVNTVRNQITRGKELLMENIDFPLLQEQWGSLYEEKDLVLNKTNHKELFN